MTDVEALDYALFSKNCQTNNKGFSSFQIVYGRNPRIPGIINSTPASLENDFKSPDVKRHLKNLYASREAFLRADNDERIKRGMSARISSSCNEFFQQGDQVSFKEEGSHKWSGPAKVLGTDGKVILIKYGNMLRRVHSSRVVKEFNEYKRGDSSSNVASENTTEDANEENNHVV